MATTHVSGTELEIQAPKLPLTKPFLVSIGVTFLVAMHIFMPNPGGSGLSLSFNVTTWLAISFSIALGLIHTIGRNSLRYNKLTCVLIACTILLTLPVFYTSSQPETVTARILGLWAGLLLFIVLQQFRFNNKQKQRLLWFILLGSLIETIFGWVQYLLLTPGNILGFDPSNDLPYGIFQHPDVMASFIATGLILSAYLLTRQTTKYQSKLSILITLCSMPVLVIPLLVVLQSPTSWLSATLSVLLLTPYLWRFAIRKHLVAWLVGCLIGVMIAIIGMLFSTKVTVNTSTEPSPLSIATYSFPQSIDMLIERPFTGYGYGRFESGYIMYTARQHQLNQNYPAGIPSLTHPHNELLYWSIEGGIIPLLAIVFTSIFILARLYQTNKGSRLATFALFLPIILHSQIEYPFYHSAIHWITLILLVYWVDQRTNRYYQLNLSAATRFIVKPFAFFLPMATLLFMLSTLHTNYVLTQFEQSTVKSRDLLADVTNLAVWSERYEWDIHVTSLNIGLIKSNTLLVEKYVHWSLPIMKEKPRPAFYRNLILAYRYLNEESKANQVLSEALFLFPDEDFSQVTSIDFTLGNPAQDRLWPNEVR